MGLKATFLTDLLFALFILTETSEPTPQRDINRQTTAYSRREADETAVVTKRPVSKQPRQQC